MSKIEKFEDLRCWQAARDLVKSIYMLCRTKELSRDFEVSRQIRSAALSVMNNIAEGYARFHRLDFVRFLNYAQSSAAEVKSILYVIEDIGYAERHVAAELRIQTDSAKNMILALIKYIKNKDKRSKN